MERADVLVAGGGVAGLSLARHLAEGGAEVAVLEREEAWGRHASGRNAGLLLHAVPEPLLRDLTVASAVEYRRHVTEVGLLASGSLLLGPPGALAARRDPRVASALLSPAEARERVPLLRGGPPAPGLLTADDGVLDPERALRWMRRAAAAAGARPVLGAEVTEVRDGSPLRVETTRGTWRADRLVIAAGAWAAPLAERAGAAPLPLRPHRRHLFVLEHRLDERLPYVWDLGRELYFRPHREGTLACMCDEEPSADLVARVAPDAEARLRGAFAPWLPELAAAPLVRAWACFRTRAPDGLPVVGPDPRRAGVWWLAGLAGHGLGTAPELGRIAAEGMLRGASRLPAALLPERLF